MTEVIDIDKPEGKVYTEKTFGFATFFAGPFVGAYMMSENFKVLGQRDKIKLVWLISIFITIIVIGVIMIIPDDVRIPRQLFPIVYTLIGIQFFKKYQTQAIDSHLYHGGLKHSWINITLVIFIGIVVTITPVILLFIYDY